MNELWVDVLCNSNYEVSDEGRVRSKKRMSYNGKNAYRRINSKILKQWITKGGYLQVETYLNGKMSRHTVHRLVFDSFTRIDCEMVNHIDEDKTNNWLYNLEASDGVHNAIHSSGIEYSLKSPDGIIHTGRGVKKFCRDNNLTPQCIAKLYTGDQKQHKGWTLAN